MSDKNNDLFFVKRFFVIDILLHPPTGWWVGIDCVGAK